MPASVPTPTPRKQYVSAALITLLAIVLRLPNLGWGLPEIEEEALPLKKAFEMWGWGEGRLQLDPQTAGWPSLSFYIHLLAQHLHYWLGLLTGAFSNRYDYFLQQVDLTPVVLVGRSLGVAAAGGVTWIGARLGGRLAGLPGTLLAGLALALSLLMLRHAQLITPDILLLFFSALAISRIVAIEQRGHWRDYLLAGLWVGLGASCKYTPILLIPVLWTAHGMRRRHEHADLQMAGVNDRRFGLAALGAFAGFALTSPFVVANLGVFQRDFAYQSTHLGGGHLGQDGGPAWGFYLNDVLASALGWPMLLLCLFGLGWQAWRRRGPWLILAISFLMFFLFLGVLTTRFDRYMLPVLLPLALGPVGLWIGLRDLLKSRPRLWRHGALAVLLGVTLLPSALGCLSYHGDQSQTSTLQLARQYIVTTLDDDRYFVMEPYSPELPRQTQSDLRATPVFSHLSTEQQARYLDQPSYNVLYLPLYVSRVELGAFYYDLRLLLDYDYVMTSSAVRGRYENQAERFKRRTRFYEDLDQYAHLERTFSPGEDARGPELRLYRIDDNTRRRLLANKNELKPNCYEPFVDRLHQPHFEAFLSLAADHAYSRKSFSQADLFYSMLWQVQAPEQQLVLLPNIAMTKMRTGQTKDAAGFLQELVRLQPENAQAFAYLGYVSEQLGETEEARKAYEQAIVLGRSNPRNRAAADWAQEQLVKMP